MGGSLAMKTLPLDYVKLSSTTERIWWAKYGKPST